MTAYDGPEAYLTELVVEGLLQAEVRQDGQIFYWCPDPEALNAYESYEERA